MVRFGFVSRFAFLSSHFVAVALQQRAGPAAASPARPRSVPCCGPQLRAARRAALRCLTVAAPGAATTHPQGAREPRLEGEEYFGVIEEFCQAVKSLWPHALLQVRRAGLFAPKLGKDAHSEEKQSKK